MLSKEEKLYLEYNQGSGEPHTPIEDAEFSGWLARAEIAQAEEAKLQAKITELQQKLAKYENPDYVLVPRNPSDKVLTSLSGNKVNAMFQYKAMIEEVEKSK